MYRSDEIKDWPYYISVGLFAVFIIFSTVFLPLTLHAAKSSEASRLFENFPINSNKTVYVLDEDSRGYIWLGTSNGLLRFNGLEYESFLTDSLQCTVYDLKSETDGIWVASENGLKYFSFHDAKLYSCGLKYGTRESAMSQAISRIVKDDRQLYILDNSGRICRHTGKRKFEPLFEGNDIFYGLASYKPGLLIASGSKGLWLLSAKTGRVVDHLDYKSTVMSFRTSVYYDNTNDTGYIGYGIGFNSVTFKIERNKIRLAETKSVVPHNLMAITTYRGKTVFAVDSEGLLIKEGDVFRKISPDNSNLPSDAIYSLFVDSNDNLWLGSYRHGVSMHSYHFDDFMTMSRKNGKLSYDIVASTVADEDKIYIGFDGGGMEIYDRHTGKSRIFTTDNSNSPGNNVLSIIQYGDNLWMSIYAKVLVKYSISKDKFENYPLKGNVDWDNNNVWTIIDDKCGHIWIGAHNVYRLDKESGEIMSFPSLNETKCTSFGIQGHNLWISSNGKGIYKVDTRSGKTLAHYNSRQDRIKLPSDHIKFLFIDQDGKLWFSTEQSGFYTLDEKGSRLKSHTSVDGLTNTDVTSIQSDKDGNLWLATFNGLFKMNKRFNTFVRYDVKEIEQTPYTYNSSFYDGKEMFFGNVNGLVYFNPEKIKSTHANSEVHFTSLRILNGDKDEFLLLGGATQELKLSHDQNFLTVSYSMPEYLNPKKLRFSCRLNNLESEWRDLGDSREVTYTNLPPGKYELQLRSTDEDGTWGKPSTLRISVSPPWWKTSWATCLWIMLGLLTIGGSLLIYLREQKIAHNMKINEIEKKAIKQLNEEKLDFYTSMTHELRTPVFLITSQLEDLLEKGKPHVNVPQSYLNVMHKSSLKLNRLVSQIIDMRKLDSGKFQLNLQHNDIVTFCKNLAPDFSMLLQQKDISFFFRCNETEIQLDFDLGKMEIILTNLISNAFKYTNAGGFVSLTLKKFENEVRISVKDNGIGIKEEMLDKVFENYFRTEHAISKEKGDGIGLHVVKTLIELHGGEIHVESQANNGSEFIFSIPCRDNGIKYDTANAKPITFDNIECPKTETISPANPTASHSVLLIDDDHEIVNVMERNLSSDYKILKAHDGEEGLEIASAQLPDVVICDMTMPRLTGLEFLERIKNDKKLTHIKVIIFTAKNSEDDILKAYDKGADVFLSKPTSLKILRSHIERLTEQSDREEVSKPNNPEQKIPEKKHTKEEQVFLLRCREIIDDNLENENFSVTFMAEMLSMSHSALYKKIRSLTGASLIEFINSYKIHKAVQLFRHGESNIEDVGRKCGFHDTKSFRVAFKKIMNQTPKSFVQNL